MELSTLRNILNQVYAGKKLTLEFASVEDRETFRVKLYKLKGKEDELVRVMEEQIKTLRFEKFEEAKPGEDFFVGFFARVYTIEKKDREVFRIVEIEDEPSQPPKLGPESGTSN